MQGANPTLVTTVKKYDTKLPLPFRLTENVDGTSGRIEGLCKSIGTTHLAHQTPGTLFLISHDFKYPVVFTHKIPFPFWKNRKKDTLLSLAPYMPIV